MKVTQRYKNPTNNRSYILEFGSDLLGHHFINVRYGIELGIMKQYLFDNDVPLLKKVEEIQQRREKGGYILLS